MIDLEEKKMTMKKPELKFDAVVVGLGKTGLSCLRYLSQHDLTLAVTDSCAQPPELAAFKNEFSSVPSYLGEIDEMVLLAAEQLILSPGVSVKENSIKQAIEQGIPVVGDIELFCQQADAPIIAVTGSNGKSTVTTLLAEMIEQAGLNVSVGGNLGTPALDLLNDETPDVYVLELSSFQLETCFSLNAHASVVLNISPDHMDRYTCLKDYASAKHKVYAGHGLMVINDDDAIVSGMRDANRNSIGFSLVKRSSDGFGLLKIEDDIFLCQGEERIINKNELLIKGEHNIANALAAMALASSLHISTTAMVKALRCFSGLEHRCQWVKESHGINWYNDSKATNVGACIASIRGLYGSGDIILIAGGDSKGGDLSDLKPIVQKHVKQVFLLGVDARKIKEVLDDSVNCEFVDDINDAVIKAKDCAQSGDQVLLAPACASLDMYKNYQERGEMFVAAVHALDGE